MILFGIAAAVLTFTALIIILPPLLKPRAIEDVSRQKLNLSVYRDQLRELETDYANGLLSDAEYQQAKREVEQNLLQDVALPDSGASSVAGSMTSAIIVALAVPVFAGLLYFKLGEPDAVSSGEEMSASSLQFQSPAQLQEIVSDLKAALASNPDDGETWTVLARAHLMLGEFPEAVQAFKEAESRVTPDAQFYADLSDATAMAQNGNMQGEPLRLLGQALALDPNNEKALWLFGTAAFEAGDLEAALVPWRRLLGLLPAGSESAQTMQDNITQVEAMLANVNKSKLSPAQATVSGTVSLADELKAEVAPDAAVFVFALAADGPQVPLAALRTTVAELPLEFTLDDGMAMVPAMRLSTVTNVVLKARVSMTGDAIARSGDLQGSLDAVAVGSGGNQLIIDSRVP